MAFLISILQPKFLGMSMKGKTILSEN